MKDIFNTTFINEHYIFNFVNTFVTKLVNNRLIETRALGCPRHSLRTGAEERHNRRGTTRVARDLLHQGTVVVRQLCPAVLVDSNGSWIKPQTFRD